MNAVIKNLGELDVRASHLFEARLAHIKELAYELAGTLNTPLDSDWLQNLKEAYFEARGNITWDGIEENRAVLETMRGRIENLELAVFSGFVREFVADENLSADAFFNKSYDNLPSEAKGKVAFIENTYTNAAYSRFCDDIQTPSSIYFDNFSAICDEVSSLRCEFCILPIENSDDGKLFGFYKLLSQNELNIVATTRVSPTDESKSTSFALVKKGMENISEVSAERYFEFCVGTDLGVNIGELCAAAELFGISLNKIDCAPRSYSENEFEYYIVLDISDADLYSFLIYLYLKTDRYTPVGIYTKIK